MDNMLQLASIEFISDSLKLHTTYAWSDKKGAFI